MRVLVAEDDRSVAAALTAALTRAGHTCVRVARGDEVLARYRDVDAVLLDLGLEDMDGLDALRDLRRVSSVPVLVVTARGDERSTVHALRLGADDYLVKPVRVHELLARLLAVTRRYAQPTPEFISVGDATLDAATHEVRHDDATVTLTPTEAGILRALARRPGTPVARRELLAEVWGDDHAVGSRALDVHLAQLRRKLPMVTITTIRGVGFRLEERR
ncbi:response regulator transcription factor [Leucobacter chromiireducens]|uniref:DNA-binding response regulator n=1 Tax=Leucobacter chromiireducens subsp. chromiireducens TaxID=660067 RepID=A0ABS1SRM8_9MICO|nr:response regulator transcription factor [Leucobacter chromiireducens]MBL3690791.1 DNA-binding response regulator [Leucobacter chromiireducens subsp. chromiireducens]